MPNSFRSTTSFKQFVNRMWLDYCDENNDPVAGDNRLDLDEYKKQYNSWLLQQYAKRVEETL